MNTVLVNNDAHWQQIRTKLAADTWYLFAGGNYSQPVPFELPRRCWISPLPQHAVTLGYIGPQQDEKFDPAFIHLNTDCRVQRMNLHAGGLHLFKTKANAYDVLVQSNVGRKCRDFILVPQGAVRPKVIGNDAPDGVGRYFAYMAGPESVKDSKVTVTPVDSPEIIDNTCPTSGPHAHVWRFHAVTGKVRVYCNRFGRPNPLEGVQKCIGKNHDSTGDVTIEIIGNEFWGGRARYGAVMTFGALSGADGGINEKPGAKREHQLRKRIRNVTFAGNVCDDMLIHLAPGCDNINIFDNVMTHCRDIAIDYKPTENGVDYRPWRGEPTGRVENNYIARAPGVTKPNLDLPPAVTQKGNVLA